jgi:hypothetical protein
MPNLIEFGLSGFFFLMAIGWSVRASHPVHWKTIDCFLLRVSIRFALTNLDCSTHVLLSLHWNCPV